MRGVGAHKQIQVPVRCWELAQSDSAVEARGLCFYVFEPSSSVSRLTLILCFVLMKDRV